MFQSTDFQEVIVNAHQVREKLEKLGCFQNIGIFIDTSSGKEATQNGLEVNFLHINLFRNNPIIIFIMLSEIYFIFLGDFFCERTKKSYRRCKYHGWK